MRSIIISLAFLAASSNARSLKDCFIQNDDGHSNYQCPGCQMEVDDQGHVSLLQGPDCGKYEIPAEDMADEATVQVPGCQRQIQGGQVVEELGPACHDLSARPWKTKGSSSFLGGSGAHDILSNTLEQVGSALSEGFAGLHKQPSSNGLLSTVGETPNRRCQTINGANGDTIVQCRACQVIIGDDGETKVRQGSGCSKYSKQIKKAKAKAANKSKKFGKSGKKGKKGKKLGQKTKSDGNGCTTTTDELGNKVTNCASCNSVVTINGKTVVSNDCNSDITAIGDHGEDSIEKEKTHEDHKKKPGKKNQDDDDSDDDEDADDEDEDEDDDDDDSEDDDGDDDDDDEEKEKKGKKEGKKEKAEEEKDEEGGKPHHKDDKEKNGAEKKKSKSTKTKNILRDVDFEY